MANGDTEQVGRWMKVVTIPGGHMAFCRLCGKRFKRSFLAANTNYAEALKGATEYVADHVRSEPHRAALDAYFSDEAPTIPKEELMLRELFGKPILDERSLRRDVARRAAEASARRVNHG